MKDFEAYFKISYGLYLISTDNNGKHSGYIANTAFQVTAEPSQIAISCSKGNFTTDLIDSSGKFNISVLCQNTGEDVFSIFGYKSGRDIDKFAEFEYFNSPNQCPVLKKDIIAWFDCEVKYKLDVGTHIIFVGEVTDYDLIDKSVEPITYAYYREVKKAKAPKNAPTYQKETDTKENIEDSDIKWVCPVCGYVYIAEEGDAHSEIAPGTAFENIPDNWKCPVCGVHKEDFIAK